MLVLTGCQGRHAPSPPSTRPFTHGVAAGDATADAAVLWTRAVTRDAVVLSVSADPEFGGTVMQATRTPDPAADFTIKIDTADVGALAPSTRYYYRFESNGALSPIGTFRTAPPVDALETLRFAFSGDSEAATRPHAVFATFPDDQLDFFIYLGDTIYADRDSPAGGTAGGLGQFRAKYREMRERVSPLDPQHLMRAMAATTFWCTADDHEVADDYAGGALRATDDRFISSRLVDELRMPFINNTRRYADGMRAFREYMPVREAIVDAPDDEVSNGCPRLFRSFDWGRTARFIVLDERSFRSPELSAPANPFDRAASTLFFGNSAAPGRSMLGRTQLAWLKDQLLAAQQAGQTWKFVVNQEPIQNLSTLQAGDRWDGYMAERNDILAFIAAHDIRNVVWLTTDIHVTLVNDLYYVEDLAAGPMSIFDATVRRPAAGAFEVVTGPLGFDPPAGAFIRLGLTAVNLNLGFVNATSGAIAYGLNRLLLQVGLDPLGLPPQRVSVLRGARDPLQAAVVDGFTYTIVDADRQSCTFTVRGIAANSAPASRLATSLAALGWPGLLDILLSRRAVDLYSFTVAAE